MLINLRNALITGKRLPYDAEVEYLESTGTQWIDTGVASKQTLKIRAIFETNSSTSYFAYGVRYDDSTITCATGTNTYGAVRWGVSALTGAVPRGLADVTQDSSGVWESGKFYSYSATQTVVERSGFTITLFAGRNSETTVTANMVGKFYSCKIWDNGILVRDYIPVRKGTVGYLYDRVSGKLFGNAGEGDFQYGQDVVPVEYIESHGTEYIDTGVNGSQNLRTTFDYQLVYSGTVPTSKGLFGCFTSGAKYFLYCSGEATPRFQVGMGNAYKNTIYVDELRHSIEFNNSAVSIDGSVVADFEPYEYPTAHTLLLFALQNANGGLYLMTPMRNWRVQMWDNGTPVRSFLPIRVGMDATSWEGAMMDVLTRRIYRNAGTGAFTYGNDLKYPIPAE